MEYVFDGLKINYTVNFNDKKDNAVLFLHGWGGSTASFFGVEKYLLEQNYSTINLDFLGFGQSDEPRENYSLDNYVLLVKNLLKKLKITKVCIVAHSFGGRVAIKLAAETNYVAKLVLVDSAGIKPRFNIKTFAKIKTYKLLKFLKSKKLIKTNLEKFGSGDYLKLSSSMKKVFVRIVNEDLTRYLSKIKCPTLLVWGKNDKDTPLYMAKKMKKHIKDSGLVVFKNSGHFSYIENYNDFLLVINSFLSKIL